uniref:dolichyl-phosphate-mannose--protein mannosyltransferase n=1 Tax=Biomphalaria glabrata TaxID=6526 RepID=A0A2C9JYV8_BIOGL
MATHVPNVKGQKCESKLTNNISKMYATIPVLLAVLCYINGVPGDFVHDDVLAILHNRDVTGESDLLAIFYNDFWGVSMQDSTSHKSYRPLCVLSFRLDYYLSGGDSRWFHVVNIMLHALVVFVLTQVCQNVLKMSSLATLVATSLFAVHPIHTEAVTGIVGRADVLAAVLYLLSFYMYTSAVTKSQLERDVNDNLAESASASFPAKQLIRVASSMALALAAMLTKETGITVLGVSLVYDLITSRKHVLKWLKPGLTAETKQFISRVTIIIITILSLLIMRMAMMNFEKPSFKHEDNPASFSTSITTRIFTFNYIAFYNFWLLLSPSLLCYDWTGGSIPLIKSLLDHRNICTILFYSVMIWSCWRCVRKMFLDQSAVEKQLHLFLLSVSLMVIPFSPASNMFFRVGFVIAERILYIPSIGFCILIAQGFQILCSALARFKSIFTAAMLALMLVMAAKTVCRNQVWESRETLFRSGVRDLPQNAKVHYNMGNFLKDEGNKTGAEYHYRQAIRLNPFHPSYHSNLGTVLSNVNETKECYMTALKLLPDHKNSLFNLGSLLIDEGDSAGISLVQHSLNKDPNFIEALLVMGKVMLRAKNFSAAESYIKRALDLNPHRPDVRFSYGYYMHMTDNLDAALQEYQHILALHPNELTSIQNAASIHSDRGNLIEAEQLLKRALNVKEDCEDCLSALGNVYIRMGDLNKAVISLAKATHLAPNSTKIHLRYVRALKENKQREEAREHLQHHISKFPQDFLAIWFAYNLSMEENRISDAAQYISEAVNIAERENNPALSYLYKEKADIYRLNKDLDGALKYYEKSIEISPEYEEPIVNIGSVYYLKKNYKEAETYYQRALAINPHNQLARLNLKKLQTNMKMT